MLYFLIYLFFEILITYEFATIFTPFGLFLEVLFSAIVGIIIIKDLNFSLFENMQRVLKREITEQEFISIGLFRFVGAILLIIPGVLTDIIGVLLMFEFFAKWFARKIFISKESYKNNDIIEVEIIEEKKI